MNKAKHILLAWLMAMFAISTPLPSQGRGKGGERRPCARKICTPPLHPSPKLGGDWLRTDGKTHSELNTSLHSSLDVADVPTAILSPFLLRQQKEKRLDCCRKENPCLRRASRDFCWCSLDITASCGAFQLFRLS